MSPDIRFDLKLLCSECGISDLGLFTKSAEKLYELLIEVNKATNLTRICTEEDYWCKHVADSLIIGKYFTELHDQKLKIADIGCGAGFPSIILAIAFPNLTITAIDSIGKKTNFIDKVITELVIPNLTTFTGRSREMNRKEEWQKKFDIVTARAVADARTIFREAKNFLKEDGRMILYKTPQQAEKDLPQVKSFSAKFGYLWNSTEVFKLPDEESSRVFISGAKSD